MLFFGGFTEHLRFSFSSAWWEAPLVGSHPTKNGTLNFTLGGNTELCDKEHSIQSIDFTLSCSQFVTPNPAVPEQYLL